MDTQQYLTEKLIGVFLMVDDVGVRFNGAVELTPFPWGLAYVFVCSLTFWVSLAKCLFKSLTHFQKLGGLSYCLKYVLDTIIQC